MAKRNTNWSEEKLNRYLKEGRGQGEGKGYKPWLTIQDFPSKGRASRVLGWKTRRIHHFLSDIETRYFYLLEWQDSVVDVREHFPLLNMQEVITEKEDINFNLFMNSYNKIPYVLCTSFLITVREENGGNKYYARSLKSYTELDRKLTLEKLEIERRYWKAKEIDWGIITQKEIPVAKAKNIEWVHPTLFCENDTDKNKEELKFHCSNFIKLSKNSSKTARQFAADFDKEYKLDAGEGLFIFKYLIALKKLRVNMFEEINLNSPIQSFTPPDILEDKEEIKVVGYK